MPFVQAKCPECGGMLAVDDSKKAAVCQFCGEAFIVQEAINNYITNNITNNNTTHNYGEGAIVNLYEDTTKDFIIEAGVLKEYHGASTDVGIPEGVYEISPSCFNEMRITSIKLPASLQSLNDIEAIDLFHNVELNTKNSYLTEKNNVIYSQNEAKIEAFIGCRQEYFLSDNTRELSETAKRQLKNIKHLYFKEQDLLEINCNNYELIQRAKLMGVSPTIKHELGEYNKCIRCQNYDLNSCRKELIYYNNYPNSFFIWLNFVNDTTVIFANDSINNICLTSNSLKVLPLNHFEPIEYTPLYKSLNTFAKEKANLHQ